MQNERRVVTILFCDVKGSTAAAEQLDPEEWTDIMNGAFEHMIRPVYQYEGTVARLMGDAILAFFGAPVAHEDDPQRAILAGLGIVSGIQAYRTQVKREWGIEFDVRVGINTGLVVVGEVGSDLRMEYTAMGDAINLAARMEQTAQPATVQVSEETHRLAAPLFEWEDLGRVEVKGKDQPVHTYRPLREKEQPGRLRGLESHGIRSPLVGRERELTILHTQLKNLSAGRGSVVFLTGEAGLGKTRLISESHQLLITHHQPFDQRFQIAAQGKSPITWLTGQSLSFQQTASYTPWRQVIRQSIGASESDSPAEVRRKLNFTCECCTLPGGDTPFLEALLAVESEVSLASVRGYEGEALTQRMTEATRGFVCGMAQETPTVIVFDDLHWADQASLDLLSNVADVVQRYPLLIIAVSRPDKMAGSWQLREQILEKLGADALEISLLPLSEEDSHALLTLLLTIDDLPTEARAMILKKSEGNPFYVEEVIRMLIDGEKIAWQDGRWAVTGVIQTLDIPDTLHGVLTARIDRLSEEAKFTLQVASVIGRKFYTEILATVLAENDR